MLPATVLASVAIYRVISIVAEAISQTSPLFDLGKPAMGDRCEHGFRS